MAFQPLTCSGLAVPWAWAICQCGTFTFRLFLQARGKVTASPAANTAGMLVCIICGERARALTGASGHAPPASRPLHPAPPC